MATSWKVPPTSFTARPTLRIRDRGEGKMKLFSDPGTEGKYRQLGFSPSDLALRLAIGDVSICAVERPFKGVVLIFESITPRTMCQYEASLPEHCSVEQIAGLIYVNITQNFRGSAEMCKAHFEKLGLPLFQ